MQSAESRESATKCLSGSKMYSSREGRSRVESAFEHITQRDPEFRWRRQSDNHKRSSAEICCWALISSRQMGQVETRKAHLRHMHACPHGMTTTWIG